MRQDLYGGRVEGSRVEGVRLATIRKVLDANYTIHSKTANNLFLDGGGQDRDVILPPLEEGLWFVLNNVGEFDLNVRDADGNFLGAVARKQQAWLSSSGDEWSRWPVVAQASGPNHLAGLVPDPGAVGGNVRFLREDMQWGSVFVSGVVDAFKFITDGVHTAIGSGPDTFRIRSDGGSIDPVVTNNHPTYGDTLNLDVIPGAVDHDQLLNFVADKHVAHTGVVLTAGLGLSGGGNIAASRQFDLSLGELSDLDADLTDFATYWPSDGSAGALRTPWSQVNSIFDHDQLVNFVLNEHIDHTGVSIIAGEGLKGGGNIAASRTLDLDFTELTVDTMMAPTDVLAFYDATDHLHKQLSFANFAAQLTGVFDLRYQPLDADLSAIAGLSTVGFVYRSGAGAALIVGESGTGNVMRQSGATAFSPFQITDGVFNVIWPDGAHQEFNRNGNNYLYASAAAAALIIGAGGFQANNISLTAGVTAIRGMLGISETAGSGLRMKITSTGAGAVFNQDDNSGISFQILGDTKLGVNAATGNVEAKLGVLAYGSKATNVSVASAAAAAAMATPVDGQMVWLQGQAAAGDGGARMARFKFGDSTTVDSSASNPSGVLVINHPSGRFFTETVYFYEATWWGVKADGATNNATVGQEAINAVRDKAKVSPIGATLLLPAGQINTNAEWTIDLNPSGVLVNGFVIAGRGKYNTSICTTADVNGLNFTNNNTNLSQGSGVRDLTITHSGTNNSSANGKWHLQLQGIREGVCDNIQIRNFYRGILCDWVQRTSFNDIYITTLDRADVVVGGVHSPDYAQFAWKFTSTRADNPGQKDVGGIKIVGLEIQCQAQPSTYGLYVESADGMSVAVGHAIGCDENVTFAPTGGANTNTLATIFFVDFYSDQSNAANWVFRGTALTAYRDFMFTNCNANSAGRNNNPTGVRTGVYFDIPDGTTLENVRFVNCNIRNAIRRGVEMNTINQKNVLFLGCTFYKNNANGDATDPSGVPANYGDMLIRGDNNGQINCTFSGGGSLGTAITFGTGTNFVNQFPQFSLSTAGTLVTYSSSNAPAPTLRLVPFATMGKWTPLNLYGALLSYFNGDDVGAGSTVWRDRVQGFQMAAGGTLPTYSAAAVNGKAGWSFNGTNQWFNAAAADLTWFPENRSGVWLWALYSAAGVTAQQRIVNYANANQRLLYINASNLRAYDGNSEVAVGVQAGVAIGGGFFGPYHRKVRAISAGTGGITAVDDNNATSSLGTGTRAFSIGSDSAGNADKFNGGIRHILVTRDLPDEDIERVMAWLAWEGNAQTLLTNKSSYFQFKP